MIESTMLRTEERLVFRAFHGSCPNFADRPVSWQDGADPPDVLCVDSSGQRIGVELGEWLNEDQIRSNKRLERWQDSYLRAIRSQDAEPPQNVGFVWVGPKADVHLPVADASTFRQELLTYIRQVDRDWQNQFGWRSPQGIIIKSFDGFTTLSRYLNYLHLFSKAQIKPFPGMRWIDFPNRGGAYSPKDAVDALLNLLLEKTSKYGDLHAKCGLDELYLVAYYNKALFYNSPYIAPGFDLPDVARIAAGEVEKNPGAFQKIFLFNATEPGLEVFRLWPSPTFTCTLSS